MSSCELVNVAQQLALASYHAQQLGMTESSVEGFSDASRSILEQMNFFGFHKDADAASSSLVSEHTCTTEQHPEQHTELAVQQSEIQEQVHDARDMMQTEDCFFSQAQQVDTQDDAQDDTQDYAQDATQDDAQDDAQVDTQADTQPDMQDDMQDAHDAQADTQDDAQADTQDNAQADTQDDAQADTQDDAQAVTQDDAQAVTQDDAQDDTQPEMQDDAQVDTQATQRDTQATQADTQDDAQVDTQATQQATQPDMQADMQDDSQVDTQDDAQVDTQATQADMQATQAATQDDAQVDTQVDIKAQPSDQHAVISTFDSEPQHEALLHEVDGHVSIIDSEVQRTSEDAHIEAVGHAKASQTDQNVVCVRVPSSNIERSNTNALDSTKTLPSEAPDTFSRFEAWRIGKFRQHWRDFCKDEAQTADAAWKSSFESEDTCLPRAAAEGTPSLLANTQPEGSGANEAEAGDLLLPKKRKAKHVESFQSMSKDVEDASSVKKTFLKWTKEEDLRVVAAFNKDAAWEKIASTFNSSGPPYRTKRQVTDRHKALYNKRALYKDLQRDAKLLKLPTCVVKAEDQGDSQKKRQRVSQPKAINH